MNSYVEKIYEDMVMGVHNEVMGAVKEHKEYSNRKFRYNQALEAIKKIIPKDKMDIFEKFKEADEDLDEIINEVYYERGLHDGSSLLKLINPF